MNPKVKALAWEECRTGGAISVFCLCVGFLTLAFMRHYLGQSLGLTDPEYLRTIADPIRVITIGVPLLMSFLLLQNLNYSGELTVGFPARVLRLPVSVKTAVAVALFSRTIFVFLVALLLNLGSHTLVHDAPSFQSVLLLTLFYVFVQLMDWLRKPVSGLSSVLVLLFISGLGFYVVGNRSEMVASAVSAMEMSTLLWSLILVLVLLGAYGIAVVAVHATRVGRSAGVPEIWEWPKYFSIALPTSGKAFSSPLAAQTWFELRRVGWTLPLVTSVLCLLSSVAFLLSPLAEQDGDEVFEGLRGFLVLSLYSSLFMAAIVQAVRGNIGIYRGAKKSAPHELLMPLTLNQMANAKIMASVLTFVPTMIGVIIVSTFLVHVELITDFAPEALESGTASLRELTWIILSRPLLIGVFIWAYMAMNTRLLTFCNVSLLWLATIVAIFVGVNAREVSFSFESAMAALLGLVLIGSVVATYGYAWRKGLINAKEVAKWSVIWIATAWVFLPAALPDADALSAEPRLRAEAIAASLTWSSLLILPYIAILLDMQKRRHNAAPAQNPAQHQRVARSFRTPSAALLAAIPCVAFALWLGWPAKPAYESAFRSKGIPVTLAELEQSNNPMPRSQNVAYDYLAVARTLETLAEAYFDETRNRLGYEEDFILIVGSEEVNGTDPIPQPLWQNSEEYWSAVTSQVVPRLKEIARKRPFRSRYSVRDAVGYPLYYLANELQLDTLHWTIAGDADNVAASITAIFYLAHSLDNDPLSESPFNRSHLLREGIEAIAMAMNRNVLPDTVLVALAAELTNAVPPADQFMLADHAAIRDTLRMLDRSSFLDEMEAMGADTSSTPLGKLLGEIFSTDAGTNSILATRLLRTLEASAEPWSILRPKLDHWDEQYRNYMFLLPLTFYFEMSWRITYALEWDLRMYLDTARTALAVERYRLASGSLPDDLESLVPAYMQDIPTDAASPTDQPLGYRAYDDGKFVVYSVAGQESEPGSDEEIDLEQDMLSFSVATLTERLANPIQDP